MARKLRADQLAFNQGLCESREKAKSLIMAARVIQQFPDGKSSPVLKSGQQLPETANLRLLPGKTFVSRGAYKLQTLLDGFKLDVSGWVCLDAGASTGGFTDCLLQRNARRVYAVDVGSHQLHEKLRSDPRVISMEGVNLRYAPPDLLGEAVDFFTGDLSFISLSLILPPCIGFLKPGGYLGVLIKPQFELAPGEAPKGVVKDPQLRLKAVRKIERFCQDELKLQHLGTLPASLKGPKGNQEYMALFLKPAGNALQI